MGSCASAPVHQCTSVQLCRAEHNVHRNELRLAVSAAEAFRTELHQEVNAKLEVFQKEFSAKSEVFQKEFSAKSEAFQKEFNAKSEAFQQEVRKEACREAAEFLSVAEATLLEKKQAFDALAQQCSKLHSQLRDKAQELKVREEVLQKEEAGVDARLAAENHFTELSCCPSTLNKRVRLNVGGTIFETSVMTLTAGSCMFAAMFNSQRFCLAPDLDATSQIYDVFLDRDPALFPVILSFLRTNRLYTDTVGEEQLDLLRHEAEFYAIPNMERLLSAGPPTFDQEPTENGKFLHASSFDSENYGNFLTISSTARNRAFTLVAERGCMAEKNSEADWFLFIGVAASRARLASYSYVKVPKYKDSDCVACRVFEFAVGDRFTCAVDPVRRALAVTNTRTKVTMYSPAFPKAPQDAFSVPFIAFRGVSFQFGVA